MTALYTTPQHSTPAASASAVKSSEDEATSSYGDSASASVLIYTQDCSKVYNTVEPELSEVFPREIKRYILMHFIAQSTIKDVLQLRLVCREWQSIVDYDFNECWKEVVYAKFQFPNMESLKDAPSHLLEEKRREIYSTDAKWLQRFLIYSELKVAIQAVEENRFEKLKSIISIGPQLPLRYAYADSLTLLHHAINLKRTYMALYLINQGIYNLHATDIRGETVLHRAAWNNQIEIVKALVEKGANIHATNLFGYTPLHLAAANGRLQVVRYLLEQGADINAKSVYGNTPLHRAKARGHTSVFFYLLQKGADPSILNLQGISAVNFDVVSTVNHTITFNCV